VVQYKIRKYHKNKWCRVQIKIDEEKKAQLQLMADTIGYTITDLITDKLHLLYYQHDLRPLDKGYNQ
jgi:hypothetical protein